MVIKSICSIGVGHVGCTLSSIIAFKCPEILVTVVDEDSEKIMQWNRDTIPISEPGLSEIMKECRNRNLLFSTNIITAIKNADLIFICVNIPVKASGFGKGKVADMKNFDNAARLIAKVGVGEKIVVEKSTVPVKAAESIKKILKANYHSHYQILSNPDFLSEGTAVNDLLYPERVIIGGDDTQEGKTAINRLSAVYERWIPKEKIITTSTFTSELAKLAANAFLAQRISSINSLCAICETLGSDISVITATVGMDSRIGSKFLTPSLGFGGAGLKKDLQSLSYLCASLGFPTIAEYWQQVIDMNEFQLTRFSERIINSLLNTLEGKTIAIFGFAYKKGIQDSCESPAIHVSKTLLNEGAKLHIYDPQVPEQRILEDLDMTRQGTPKSVEVFKDPYLCTSNTDAIVVCTDWDEFRTLDYEKIFADMIKPAYIFDGRNVLPHQELIKIGYNVECIGTTTSKPTPSQNYKRFPG